MWSDSTRQRTGVADRLLEGFLRQTDAGASSARASIGGMANARRSANFWNPTPAWRPAWNDGSSACRPWDAAIERVNRLGYTTTSSADGDQQPECLLCEIHPKEGCSARFMERYSIPTNG